MVKILKRIRAWLRRRDKRFESELRSRNLKLRATNDSLRKTNAQLREKVEFVDRFLSESKMGKIATIITHYETKVGHRLDHPIRVELMDKTLNAISGVIAGEKRLDIIYFWRLSEKILNNQFFW